MDYTYTYLIGDLILLLIWLILFFWRKDIRKEILIISLIFGIAGPLVEIFYIKDWWKPLTITNTHIGIEDFLFGFFIGGIIAVIYEVIFKKRIKIQEVKKIKERKRNLNIIFLLALLIILFLGSFYILNLNSLIATIIGFATPTLIIYFKRKDLIVDSLITGILALLIACLGYSLIELITPGWINEFWQWKNVPEIIILNVPIDDIFWYLFAGAFIGPLYEYWQEGKLINIKK